MLNYQTVAQSLLGETVHFGFCPPKIGFFRGSGGSPNFFFIGIFILLWLRSPCKKLKSYDTPLCRFSNGIVQRGYIDVQRGYIDVQRGYIMFSGVILMFSGVILMFSGVILMFRGVILCSVGLYWCSAGLYWSPSTILSHSWMPCKSGLKYKALRECTYQQK